MGDSPAAEDAAQGDANPVNTDTQTLEAKSNSPSSASTKSSHEPTTMRRLVGPALVYDEKGEVYDVPRETIEAVESFKVPYGLEPAGTREQSFMYSLGNFVRPIDHVNRDAQFFCQASYKCRSTKKMVPCADLSRSNVNKHFKDVHKLRGKFGLARQEKRQLRDGIIRSSMDVGKAFGAEATSFRRHADDAADCRAREMPPSKAVINQLLPVNHVSAGGSLKELAGTLTAGSSTLFPARPPPRMKHFIVDEKGEVYDVPRETIEAVESFKVPDGFEPAGNRDLSFMYSLGNFIRPIDHSNRGAKFFCQASSECRSAQKIVPCAGLSRSNVNKHFKDVHKLRGQVGLARQEKQQVRDGIIRSSIDAGKAFDAGATRMHEILAAKVIIEQLLPFNHFSAGESLKELLGTITAGSSTPFQIPSPRRMKHLLVELYVATKKVVVGDMQEEVQKALLPIMHHVLNLSTCKSSGRTFLCTHVYWVNHRFELKNALLSVKHYAPALDLEGQPKVAEALLKVFDATLAEYGLKLSDIASGTTDRRSDIEAMCINSLFPRESTWDWCVCHLASKSAEDAFGTSADPTKSRNPAARDLLDKAIKVIERLNESPTFKKKVDVTLADTLGEIFKIGKRAPQRWLSVTRALEHIVRSWHALRKLYSDDGMAFPLDEGDAKDGFLQLYSLMQPLSAIMRDGQFSAAVPMTAEMHMAFGALKVDVLDPTKALRVFDTPPLRGHDAPLPGEKGRPLPWRMVPPEELHDVAVHARKELNTALVKRLFSRVWDPNTPDPSPFRDAAVLLTPPFNTGRYLQALRLMEEDVDGIVPSPSLNGMPHTTDGDVAEKLKGAWADIEKRAIDAARKREDRAAEADGARAFKRLKVTDARPRPEGKSKFASFGRRTKFAGDDKERIGDDVVVRAVSVDISRYQALSVDPDEMEPCEVLAYWGGSGKHAYPSLAAVAQQVFGNQASVAHVERDFSGCATLLRPTRSRPETYWVEMVMFLKANFACIPSCEDIPAIDSKDIRRFVPRRFSGRDAELVAAEATIDPLTTAPLSSGMDFD